MKKYKVEVFYDQVEYYIVEAESAEQAKELFSGEITDEDGLKVELSLKQSEDNVWAVDLRIEEGEREGEYIEGHAFDSETDARNFYEERLAKLVKTSKETEPVIIDC